MTDELIRRADALKAVNSRANSDDSCHAPFLRHDIAALPAVTVGVKPLVWEDFDGLGAKASAFYQANYLIQWWKGEGRYEVALSYPGYQTGYDGDRWHDTLDAAKAAAQADYDQRILAALEPVAALTSNHVDASQTPDPAVNDDDGPCTCCEGTGITIQTERRCACQTAPDPAAIREAALRAERDALIHDIERIKDSETHHLNRAERLKAALRHAERVMTDPDCEPGNSITNAIQIARTALKGADHE